MSESNYFTEIKKQQQQYLVITRKFQIQALF